MLSRFLAVLFILISNLAVAVERGPALPDYPAKQVAPHTYVIHGPLGTPNVENQGFMNNPSFVLTPAGVVVIDPGASLQSGEMVLRQISLVTSKPVIAVLNTHMHGDHWLGNHALQLAYPDVAIYGHPEMRARVEGGVGEDWRSLMLRATQGATAGTKIVAPNRSTNDSDVLELGGMAFHIIHTGLAHTPGDLMIEIPAEDVILLGDNVLYKRLGQMDDGTFQGNLKALTRALQSSMAVFIPGHGPTGGREVVVAYQDYLSTLYQSVTRLFGEDMSDFEMKPHVVRDLRAFHDWVGFDGFVGRHINLAYLEVEAADF